MIRAMVKGPFRAALAAVALALVIAACGGSQHSERSVTAVATAPVAGDILRGVGGDRVTVRTLVDANADPHDYEPRPSDAEALGDADLVVRSGGELDGWLGGLLDSAGGDAEQLTLLDRVPVRRGNDPHWWHDPRNAAAAALAVRDALARVDPAGRAGYERRARAYVRAVRRADRGIAVCMLRLPPARRKLVTSHDALGYFAGRYGLEVIGALIPSRSTQAQPSAGETDALVRQIEREGVRAVFPESSLDSRLERAVARETGAATGAALYADTLGPPGSSGDTYLGALVANADAITAGLSGRRVRCAVEGQRTK